MPLAVQQYEPFLPVQGGEMLTWDTQVDTSFRNSQKNVRQSFSFCAGFKLSQAQQRKADSDYLLITPVILKPIHFKPHRMGIYPTPGFPAGRFRGPGTGVTHT